MSQLQNAFIQKAEKGLVDAHKSFNTLPAVIKSDEATPLVAGQAVKLVSTGKKQIVITAVTADTDAVFGFVNYNIKDKQFLAGKNVEISTFGNIMHMEASTTISAGASLKYVVSGQKVAPHGGSGDSATIIGMALESASQGDLLKVLILSPLK